MFTYTFSYSETVKEDTNGHDEENESLMITGEVLM